MKTTTTILDILASSAVDQGYNAFINPDGTFKESRDENNLIRQINNYTDFARSISNDEIFGGFNLSDLDCDKWFKKAFLNNFLHREIKYQTLDIFRSRLVSKMLLDEKWLVLTYHEFDELFNGDTNSTSNTQTSNNSESRGANATLPQDQTTLNLDDDTVPYADNTAYNRSKQNGTQDNQAHKSGADYNAMVNLNNVFNKKMLEYDRDLFLQIF